MRVLNMLMLFTQRSGSESMGVIHFVKYKFSYIQSEPHFEVLNNFCATVCKMVRPILFHHCLSVCLSVCLSATLV